MDKITDGNKTITISELIVQDEVIMAENKPDGGAEFSFSLEIFYNEQ